MPGFDGSILEIVQIFHGGVVHNLSGQNEHIVGFGALRNHDLLERRVEFHQIHAGGRRQVDFVGILHLSDGAP